MINRNFPYCAALLQEAILQLLIPFFSFSFNALQSCMCLNNRFSQFQWP